jgi:uncharacterized protein YqhQ
VALIPFCRGAGVARPRERYFLLVVLLAPFSFFLLPGAVQIAAGVALTLILIGWVARGRTLHLHGAEHRAIAAVEEGTLAATWAGHARPTRFAFRCGTNFAVLVLPVAALAERLWPLPMAAYTPLVVAVLSLAVTMELWLAIEASTRRLARIFLLPGLGLQRITTREPSLDETRIALTAAASVLRRELDTAA